MYDQVILTIIAVLGAQFCLWILWSCWKDLREGGGKNLNKRKDKQNE